MGTIEEGNSKQDKGRREPGNKERREPGERELGKKRTRRAWTRKEEDPGKREPRK
jgi:hypothetical protein